jgi:hypothetical protein
MNAALIRARRSVIARVAAPEQRRSNASEMRPLRQPAIASGLEPGS